MKDSEISSKKQIILLLHFYQPYWQQKDILERIVNESYLPITKQMLECKKSRAVFNISGGLIELLMMHKYDELLSNIILLLTQGKIELTASAKYHAFLPLLSESEIKRQINLNDAIIRKCFGDLYKPVGFFSPEMAVNENLLQVIAGLGYEWIAVPQAALTVELSSPNSYVDKLSHLRLLRRNKAISSVILSAAIQSADELVAEFSDQWSSQTCMLAVMDAETFGHHRIGHEEVLKTFWNSMQLKTLTASEYLKDKAIALHEVTVRPCTWTNEEQDFWLGMDNSYTLWNDPQNPIHTLQWELANFAIEQVTSYPTKTKKNYLKSRNLLDKALSSDQFWWASAKPWWSLEMIENGAYMLKNVINTLFLQEADNIHINKAASLYKQIVDIAFEWQRSGRIRELQTHENPTYTKIPLKDRTHAEWFNQIILEFEYEMLQAAQKQNYERAIKWRDAIIKISKGIDVFDISHVVDELWLARNIGWSKTRVKPFLSHNWPEFSDFAKKYFLNVKTEKDFEKWKNSKD